MGELVGQLNQCEPLEPPLPPNCKLNRNASGTFRALFQICMTRILHRGLRR